MSKNILVLTGSPRKNGNSDKLADAFISGAEQSGHKVNKYMVAHKNIKPCIDCKGCYKKGVACLLNDDFNELAPIIENADVIVFATPLYAYSFPSVLNTALDKFNTFLVGERHLNIKESALLVTGGDMDENMFDGIIATYKSLIKTTNCTNIGIITAQGLMGKDDILNTNATKEAEQLGKSI